MVSYLKWRGWKQKFRPIFLQALLNHWALRDFLTLTDPTFLALFRQSPIRRIKRPAFLRNLCTALGNIGTREDLPALQIAAEDSHELIAEHAIWAIQEIQLRYPSS